MSLKQHIVTVVCCSAMLIGIVWIGLFLNVNEKEEEEYTWEKRHLQYKEKNMHVHTYGMNYTRDFNDLQDKHAPVAQALGIAPCATRSEIEKRAKQLVKIESCNEYVLRDLTHSSPYLIPKAKKLLDKIGKNFQDSLQKLEAPMYRLQVTSVLRTDEDVKDLGRGNVNASKNSVHRYGTTFDISWTKFEKADWDNEYTMNEDNMKRILGRVLADLKKDGWCYVKYEKKQACFHITVRK